MSTDDLDPHGLPEFTELVYWATAEELSVILSLLGKGFTSYSNVFRVALHNLAHQVGVEVPTTAFQLRSLHAPRKARTPASPKTGA